jgi:exodeoxyribonuclease V beta subunit
VNPDPTAGSASTAELNVFECGLDGINQIEASAGTGKTWNMCALYLRLLLERQLPVQQILVVTFTKAATAELRERIRSRIGDAVRHLSGSEEAETANADTFIATLVATLEVRGITRDAMSAMLELALQSFDEASIFTIHGFCQRALADAPFAAGMPFATDLQPSDDDLALRAAQDFWRRHISSGSLDTEVIDHLLESKDAPDRFAKLLQRYLAKPMSRMIWPDDIDTDYTPHQAQLDAAFDAAIGSWTASADAIRALMHASLPELNGVTYKAQAVDTSCAAWQAVFDAGRSAPIPDPDESKLVLLTLQRLVKGTKKARSTPKHAFFGHAETLLTLLAQAKAERNLARLRLLRLLFSEGSETLARIKREQRIQSYDDILRNVHAALHSDATPWLTGALLAQYPAALIDEFQDTDPLQFAIFDKIYGTGANPLFFVGDPKQAIYSFRNADLQTYLKARDKATARHSLAHNQRSSEGLIAAQNALFSANPRAFLLDGLDYQPVHFGSKPRAAFVDDSAETAALQIWQLASPWKTELHDLQSSAPPRPKSRGCSPLPTPIRCTWGTARCAPAISQYWSRAMRKAARCVRRWRDCRSAASNCRRRASSTVSTPRNWSACCKRCSNQTAPGCCWQPWQPSCSATTPPQSMPSPAMKPRCRNR